MTDTAVLIGSVPVTDTINIDSAGVVTINDDYYLRHTTASLSLMDKIATEMTNAGLASVSVTMLENGKLRFQASTNFDFVIGSTLAALLGITTTEIDGTASDYTASMISPLFWAPGYPATPRTIPGKVGYRVPHITFHAADDGSVRQTQHFGSERWQELMWGRLVTARLTVADGSDNGNTFEGLYEYVLQYGYRFFHHESVAIDYTGSSAIAWNDSQRFGPYQLRQPMPPDWYERIIPHADAYGGPLILPLAESGEYG